MNIADPALRVVGTVEVRSADQTEAFGAKVASALRPGDRLLLVGGLGAGKTTFVRGLVRGAGSPHVREVASPTFALHHRYPDGRLVVDHCDLYRLNGPVDLAAEGLEDVVVDPGNVLCVEWPERLARAPAGHAATLTFEFLGEEARRITVRARPEAADRLAAVFA